MDVNARLVCFLIEKSFKIGVVVAIQRATERQFLVLLSDTENSLIVHFKGKGWLEILGVQ